MNALPDSTINHLRGVLAMPDLGSDRYELREVVGEGGMGTVYRARDRELRRDVAVKLLKLTMTDADAARRLMDEAMIVARLEHPGIVPVHDAGTCPDGRVYYVMKLVRGTRLDDGPPGAGDLDEKLRVFERVCETVAFAHAHGVIHRDLKPQNVMCGEFGEVLVLDWGVARIRDASFRPRTRPRDTSRPRDTHVDHREGHRDTQEGHRDTQVNPRENPRDTQAAADSPGDTPTKVGTGATDTVTLRTRKGTIVGTPAFMAPEQASGDQDAVDERTDVYGLGGILLYLLTGRTPRDAEHRKSGDGPTRSAPRTLLAVCNKALAADPDARYPDANALASEIRQYLSDRTAGAYRASLWERAWRTAVKYQAAIVIVIAYLVLRFLIIWLSS